MKRKIIDQLLSIQGLRIQCPLCDEEFPIKKGRLFNMYDPYPPSVERIIRQRLGAAHARRDDLTARRQLLTEEKQRRPERIRAAAQGANFGKIAEQIIPAFVTFPYKQSECRPLFDPIDYVAFCGLAARGRVEAIKFVDVKTGQARLTDGQKQIRDRILQGRVKHRVIGQ